MTRARDNMDNTSRTGCQRELMWMYTMNFFDFIWTTWTRQCDCSRYEQCWHEQQGNMTAASINSINNMNKTMWLLRAWTTQAFTKSLARIRPSALKSACDPAKPRTWCFWAIPGQRLVFHSGKFEYSATSHSTTTPYDSYLLRLPPSYSLWLSTTP